MSAFSGRLRIRFSKVGKVRWTSHRDVARMWERAFRRVDLPLAFTQGFSPRPKVSFGLALPTGHESVAEYLDVELAPGTELDASTLPALLSPALPVGIDVLAAVPLDERAASLQEEVTSCDWLVEVANVPSSDRSVLSGLVDRALAADSLVITRQRKGRDVTDDVRPGILALTLDDVAMGGAGHPMLRAELATQPRGLRPAEMLAALGVSADGLALEEGRVRRLHQWIQRDGARSEPIEVPTDATNAPHLQLERAS
jgi:radical SAM-linked protein